MKKKSGRDHEGKTLLFRLFLNLPAILFLLSMSRGTWYYQFLPEVVPPLLPVLWPFSMPLPRSLYLLLPLVTGTFLYGSRIWAREKEGPQLPLRDEAAPGEGDSGSVRHGPVQRLRQQVSRPIAVSFILQMIVVSLYSYIQERLLTNLPGGLDFASRLSRIHGFVLALFLAVFLFTLMIRMYRKENPLA